MMIRYSLDGGAHSKFHPVASAVEAAEVAIRHFEICNAFWMHQPVAYFNCRYK
jgi:hypothetical protein